MAEGQLRVQCYREDSYVPVDNCNVTVNPSSTNPNEFKRGYRVDLKTDSSGSTSVIDLAAPPIEYSQNPSNNAPYSLYDITVERSGFEQVIIRNVQVFPERTALQKIELSPSSNTRAPEYQLINILPNTLFGDYPAKIPENPDKPLPKPSSGVVLAKPVIPEFVTVHQGSPNDATAPNYTVYYKDYIKNVASCEIYSTWPESTIRANLLCFISLTFNRVYSEWYRGKGKNFDITSSTAYDHAFNYGRYIYDNISAIADEIFSTFVKRYGRKQPLLTQYCDGKSVTCPEWLSQWGSKYLGDQGKAPYEILTYYYGNDIELSTADEVKGSPSSYPGYDLTVGSSGEEVRMIQEFLNRISQNYPLIPKVAVDGTFDDQTKESVKVFQSVFNLPQTGTVDYATWYKISDVYVGVSKIAELRGSLDNTFYPPFSNNVPKEFRPNFRYPS